MFNLKNLFLLCLTLCYLVDVQAQCTATKTEPSSYSTATCSPSQVPFLDLTMTPNVSLNGFDLCIKLNENITNGLLPEINESSAFLEVILTLEVKVIDENNEVFWSDTEFLTYKGNGASLPAIKWGGDSPYSATVNLDCSKGANGYRVTMEIIQIDVGGVAINTHYCTNSGSGGYGPYPVINLNNGAYTISAGVDPTITNILFGDGYDELGFYENSNGDIYVTRSAQCSESPCEYGFISDNPIVLHDALVVGNHYFDINLTNNTSPLNFTVSTNGGVINKYQVQENVVFTKGNCKIVPFALSTGTYIWGGSFSVTPSASANNIAVRAWNLSNGCEVLYVYEKDDDDEWGKKCEATFGSLKQSPVEEAARSSFSVYPIPAQDYLNIEHGSAIQKIEVVDVSGRIITSEVLETGFSNYRLDVADLMNGIYFVRIQNELGEIYTKKFVK